jgi:hypothetical protein
MISVLHHARRNEWLLGRLLAAVMTVMTMMATGDETSDAVTYTGTIRATSVGTGAGTRAGIALPNADIERRLATWIDDNSVVGW